MALTARSKEQSIRRYHRFQPSDNEPVMEIGPETGLPIAYPFATPSTTPLVDGPRPSAHKLVLLDDLVLPQHRDNLRRQCDVQP